MLVFNVAYYSVVDAKTKITREKYQDLLEQI